MKIEDLEKKIDLLSLVERKFKVKGCGANSYRINPCPICGGNDHFTIKSDENYYKSFSDCCRGGGPYKYLIEVEGMDENTAYEELCSLAGEISTDTKKSDSKAAPTKAEPIDSPKDYTDLLMGYYHNQTDIDKDYFRNRGLSDEVIDCYKLSVGVLPGDGYRRAIIPVWKGSQAIGYNARAIDDIKPKYKKPKGAFSFLNDHYLDDPKPGDVIFIAESEFDALSIESIGHKAIGLGGSQNASEVASRVSEGLSKGVVVLTAFDNDSAGDKARASLPDCPSIDIPMKYKDLNEWVMAEREAFRKSIDKQIAKGRQPYNLLSYLNESFISDQEAYQDYQGRKTGYSNIDSFTSLYPGLYAIGGLSSLGKTTFIHQMADQIASVGDHVIYYSLEMSRFELVSKSLSRLTAKSRGQAESVSSINIRLNDIGDMDKRFAVQEAVKSYSATAKNISVVEGNFDTTVKTIRDYTEHYSRVNGVKPVVIIDYLQIVQVEGQQNDKQRIDTVVTDLKRMSRDLGLPVIAVSSLNRGNYLTPIDFESFKESGGIEYTADVVWGLQLECLNEDVFNKAQAIKEKRERISEAKKENPRHIELVCLKNRNGMNYRGKFLYYPHCDLFEPDHIGDFGKEVKSETKVF